LNNLLSRQFFIPRVCVWNVSHVFQTPASKVKDFWHKNKEMAVFVKVKNLSPNVLRQWGTKVKGKMV
jgi:hypothetical protein